MSYKIPRNPISWSAIQASPSGSSLRIGFKDVLNDLGHRFNLRPEEVELILYAALNPQEAKKDRQRRAHRRQFNSWPNFRNYMSTVVRNALKPKPRRYQVVPLEAPIGTRGSGLTIADTLVAMNTTDDEASAVAPIIEFLREEARQAPTDLRGQVAQLIVKNWESGIRTTQTTMAKSLGVDQSTVSRIRKSLLRDYRILMSR